MNRRTAIVVAFSLYTALVVAGCLLASGVAGAQALTVVHIQITAAESGQRWLQDAVVTPAACNLAAPQVEAGERLVDPPTFVFDDRENLGRVCRVPFDAAQWAALPVGAYTAQFLDASGVAAPQPPVPFQKHSPQPTCPDGVPADWIMVRFEDSPVWKKALICKPA